MEGRRPERVRDLIAERGGEGQHDHSLVLGQVQGDGDTLLPAADLAIGLSPALSRGASLDDRNTRATDRRQNADGVQNVGDGNTIIVYAGAAELRLEHGRRAQSRAQNRASGLLRALNLRSTTLVSPSDHERNDLRAWLFSATGLYRSVASRAGRAGASPSGH